MYKKTVVKDLGASYNLKMLFAIVSMAVLAAFLSAYGYGKWRASDLSAKASSYTAIYPLDGKIDVSKVTIRACADKNTLNIIYTKATNVEDAIANLWLYNERGDITNQKLNQVWYDNQITQITLPVNEAKFLIGRVNGNTTQYKVESKTDRISISKLAPC